MVREGVNQKRKNNQERNFGKYSSKNFLDIFLSEWIHAQKKQKENIEKEVRKRRLKKPFLPKNRKREAKREREKRNATVACKVVLTAK